MADITNDFSFAYMQEAFIAALLAIARQTKESQPKDNDGLTEELGDDWVGVLSISGGGLDKCLLWVEIQKQVKILREGMDNDNGK